MGSICGICQRNRENQDYIPEHLQGSSIMVDTSVFIRQSSFQEIAELEESMDAISKSHITLRTFTLNDLASSLQKVFDRLESIRGQDLILAVSQPRAGRSTLLSYLAFGPEKHTMSTYNTQAFGKVVQFERKTEIGGSDGLQEDQFRSGQHTKSP